MNVGYYLLNICMMYVQGHGAKTKKTYLIHVLILKEVVTIKNWSIKKM